MFIHEHKRITKNRCKREKIATKIATKQKNQKPTLEREYKRLQQSNRNNNEVKKN